MWARFWFPLFVVVSATPSLAKDERITNVGDGIASYRLSAAFCHWPIPADINNVLNSDQGRFSDKDPGAYADGVKNARERFQLLIKSDAHYCEEIKESRGGMTADLKSRVK